MQDEDKGGRRLVSYDTYAKLVETQRRQLEREIQDESKALALTQRFLAESEQTQKSKFLRQHELDQKLFEREIERWEKALGEEKLLKRIEKGEKAQVHETMVNQLKQEKQQVANEKKKQDDVRMLHDAKRAWWKRKMDKLREADELKRNEIADMLKEKQRKHEQLLLEQQEKLAERKKTPDSLSLDNGGVFASQLEDIREAVVPKEPEKRRVGPSPRMQRILNPEERIRSPTIRRDEQRGRKQLVDQDRACKLMEQLEKKRLFDQRREHTLEEQSLQRIETSGQREERRLQITSRRDQMLQEDELRAQQKLAEQKKITVPQVDDSAHCEAARKYVKIKMELNKRRDKMVMTKRWKLDDLKAITSPMGSLTSRRRRPKDDGEDSECDGEENKQDAGAARLQSLYDQYVKDKPIPRDAINYDRMHGVKKQRVFGVAKLRCGLCEQAYVVENLPGLTTRATIGKMRDKWREQSGEVQTEERGKGLSGLYDKVALCALCFQFVQENKT